MSSDADAESATIVVAGAPAGPPRLRPHALAIPCRPRPPSLNLSALALWHRCPVAPGGAPAASVARSS
jgi:hypothetical protein